MYSLLWDPEGSSSRNEKWFNSCSCPQFILTKYIEYYFSVGTWVSEKKILQIPSSHPHSRGPPVITKSMEEAPFTRKLDPPMYMSLVFV